MKKVYFLKWKNSSLIVNDYTDLNLMENLTEGNISVSYGGSLTDVDHELIKTEFRVNIEKAVNRWINDSKFLIHLLLSAGVFLVSFYFLSYVVRDPVPFVDEIILSFVLAGLAWYRLKNQQNQSEKVIQKKVELEQYLSDVSYESSDFVTQVELYLEKLGSMDQEERSRMIESGAVPVFFTSEKKELVTLLRLLENYKKKNRFKKGYSFPLELTEFISQIRAFLKYHSSMV